MEKKEVKAEEKKGLMTMENRKKLSLNGVMEVVSFNDEKIVLKSNLGNLTVKGTELKMNRLDVQNGDIVIMGIVDGIFYNNDLAKPQKENVLKKLFK